MVTYTKHDSLQLKGTKHSVFALTATLCLIVFLLGSLTSKLIAQCAATTNIPAGFVNGDPSDWANVSSNPVFAYKKDAANAGSKSDDAFKGGKDTWDLNRWSYWDQAANDKGDITNAAAILTSGTGSSGSNCILRFAADRTDNSGACNIGFWFFRNGLTLQNGNFTPNHANGDLLILVSLTQGGEVPVPKVYLWQNGNLVQVTDAKACAAVNPNDNTTVPAGFTYSAKGANGAATPYAHNTFFEGALDLCASNIPNCFAFFLVETRQSPSEDAALEDFAAGTFNATPAPPTAVNNNRCGPGNITLSPTGCTGNTIKWYEAETGGSAIRTGTPQTFNLTASKTYYISCAIGTCESARVPIVATINDIPAAPTLTVVQPSCSTALGSVTVTAPIGSDFRYSFDGGTNFGTTKTTTFAAGAGYSVIVKNNVTGCISAATSCPAESSVTQAAGNKEESPQAANTVDILARIEGKTKVLAAPNPFTDKVRFTLQSDVSGQGSLEIYNTMGQKVATVYQGYVEAGKVLNKEYSVKRVARANLIYVFRVGDQKTTGRLLNW